VGSRMTFGVNAGGKRWTRTISGPHLERNIPAFAVEVGKKHLSWFLNGKVVGAVRSKAAVPGVPLTLRMGLVAAQSGEYDNTSTYSDWQRHFGITSGRQTKSGPKLKKQALGSCPG
ncbi:MAG: hypothetical protein WBP61_05910, partial [Nocardioides sp.]